MSGDGITPAAVEVVDNASEDIEEEVKGMDGEADAGDILEATGNINDSTNQAAAATAATQKEDQMKQQAVSTLK